MVAGTLAARHVRGPIAAVIRALGEADWEPTGPEEWTLPGPGLTRLDAHAPRVWGELAGQAAEDKLWSKAAENRPRDAQGTQHGVDKTVALGMLRTADPKRAGAIRCVLAGAVATAARRHRRMPEEEPTRCTRCGKLAPDEIHLFWTCPADEVARTAAGITRQMANRIASEAPPCFAMRGLVPRGWTTPPAQQIPDIGGAPGTWWRDRGAGNALEGPVATDGAAAQPGDPRLRRAAWGLFCEATGRQLWGPVRGPENTVFKGESVAILQALKRVNWDTRREPAVTLLIDNQAAVNRLLALKQQTWEGPRTETQAETNSQAALEVWTAIAEIVRDRGHRWHAVWVPSHTGEKTEDKEVEKARADRLARARQQ